MLNWQWFWFQTSQKTGPWLKVSFNRLGEPGIELGTLWYKVSGLSFTPLRLLKIVPTPSHKPVLAQAGKWFCGFMSRRTRMLSRQLFWFKTSQKMGPQLKVSSDRLGEPVIELGILGNKVSGLSTTPL